MKEEIKDNFLKVLDTFSQKEPDSQTSEQLIIDIHNFIKTQSEKYPEKNVIQALQFITHPDKIKKYPKLKAFQEKYIIDSSGLFGVVGSARIYQVMQNADESAWVTLRQELVAQLATEKNDFRQKILKAQIQLLDMIIQFDENTEHHFGKEYKDIIGIIPFATTAAMSLMAPYLSSFIILNNIVQQMLYHNRVPSPGILRTLHSTFLSLSSVLIIPSNLAAIGLCYLNVFLADNVLRLLRYAYNSLVPSMVLENTSRALIEPLDNAQSNTILLNNFHSQEFSVIANMLYKYINEKRSAMIPGLWEGTTKASLMEKYVEKLVKIDGQDRPLIDKLRLASTNLSQDLEHNKIITGSGQDAVNTIKSVSTFLKHRIEAISKSAEITETLPDISENTPTTS